MAYQTTAQLETDQNILKIHLASIRFHNIFLSWGNDNRLNNLWTRKNSRLLLQNIFQRL